MVTGILLDFSSFNPDRRVRVVLPDLPFSDRHTSTPIPSLEEDGVVGYPQDETLVTVSYTTPWYS